MQLTAQQIQRYARHLPVIGIDGQQKLLQANILCIGAGGLGCPALQYLSAAGVGHLGIIDDDVVSLSNLQRQILYKQSDVGKAKVDCAAEWLKLQNSLVNITTYQQRLTRENGTAIVADYDIVIDGSDNYRTRYLINDLCHQANKPLISASIYQFHGQCSIFHYQQGPCYRCLFPTPPPDALTPNCAQAGVLGVLPGVMGSLQAIEAIKLLIGQGQLLAGRLLVFDALSMTFDTYQVPSDPHCPLCQKGELSDGLFAKTSAVESVEEITPKQLQQWLAEPDAPQLLDVREDYEREICHINGEFLPLSRFSIDHVKADKNKPLVVYCKAGVRSRQASIVLSKAGFRQVYNLNGGILRWIDEVEPHLQAY